MLASPTPSPSQPSGWSSGALRQEQSRGLGWGGVGKEGRRSGGRTVTLGKPGRREGGA